MRLPQTFKDAFAEHIPLYFAVLFALGVGLVAELSFDLGGETLFVPRYLPEFMIIFACAPLPIMLIRIVESLIRRYPFAKMKSYVAEVLAPSNILRVLICFVCVYAAISIFSTVKSQIGLRLTPDGHDLIFIEIERLLHGGRLPHEFFDFIFAYPEYKLLHKIDFFYWLWFFVLYVYLAWVVYQPPGAPGRMRYMVSFILCWSVIGNVLAAAGASAGPVFWQYFVEGPNPYVAFLDKIELAHAQEPLFRNTFRNYMLYLVNNEKIVDINGPAALPSVHVGMAMLFVLHSALYIRWLLPLTVPFLAIIMVGSVMLAWHYAIDGYVAIIAMVVIWLAVGRWVEKRRADI